VEQASYYIGTGNTKWVLIGLAVVMAIVLFKRKR
jgi:LPXTG-motif cell wall-anchored protein